MVVYKPALKPLKNKGDIKDCSREKIIIYIKKYKKVKII